MQLIKFVDLPAQIALSKAAISKRIGSALDSASFVGGAAVEEFEAKAARYLGVKHVIGCGSGTDALTIAFRAAGLQPGERVLVPTNSFIATAYSVSHAGCQPVFVDVDPDTYLLDANLVEAAIQREGVRKLAIVHLYGSPANMDDLLDLANRYELQIFEDNAQAIGAEFAGRKTGTFGAAGAISFYPSKNLGACGQAGAISTNDDCIAKTCRSLTEQGQFPGDPKYHHRHVGYNSRLQSIQACVLTEMIEHLEDFNNRRRAVAEMYRKRLSAARLQLETPRCKHAYHLFVYRCEDKHARDRVADRLARDKIGFGYHYPIPIHKQLAYADYNHCELPVSERLAETLISLPMHPFLKDEEVEVVCQAVQEAASK